jgi:hypothetical protein
VPEKTWPHAVHIARHPPDVSRQFNRKPAECRRLVKPVVVRMMPHDAASDGRHFRVLAIDVRHSLPRAAPQPGPSQPQPVGHGDAGDLIWIVQTG